jgi:MFS transporter, PPP family, 3-phenylpropionic acid transporter
LKKIWPFSFYYLIFSGVAFIGPFIVLFYQSLGFSGAQIGLLTGLTPLIAMVGAPFWSGLADASQRHRRIMNITLLVTMTTMLVFPFLRAFAPVMGFLLIYNFFFSPVSALSDSATIAMLGDDKHMYGRVRLGGTFGFGLSAPVAGVLVEIYGLIAAFLGCAVLLLLSVLVSQKFVYSKLREGSFSLKNVRVLMANPRWIYFLCLAFSGGFGLACAHYYFFPYMKELGAKESMMGLALTIGMFSEIPMLFYGHKLLKRFKAIGLMKLALAATALRLLLLAATVNPSTVLIIQLLGGLTFPVVWIAGVSFVDEFSPKGMKATGQGIFNGVTIGFGLAVGGFLGGILLDQIGGRGLNFVFGLVVLAVLVIVSLLMARVPDTHHLQSVNTPSTD